MPQGTAGGGSLQVSGPPMGQWAARGPMKKSLKNNQHQPAGLADFISTPGPSEPINLGELEWPSIKTAMDVDYLCALSARAFALAS